MVKVAQITTKQNLIGFAPECLCLHMQRSLYLPSGHSVKNNAPVVFEDELDINSLVLNSFFAATATPSPSALTNSLGISPKSQEELMMQFASLSAELKLAQSKNTTTDVKKLKTSKVTTDISEKKVGPFRYQLTAVILHYGHHESGHFVTLRKVKIQDANHWFRCSDATIEKIVDVENDVFAHGSRFAYMLFYERNAR